MAEEHEARGDQGTVAAESMAVGRAEPRWRRRAILGAAAAVAGTAGAFMIPRPMPETEVEVSVAEVGTPSPAGDAVAWDLANLDHERVDFWIARFDTVPDMRKKMEGFLYRSGHYVPMLTEKLEARGMPTDLIYLAMIESGFEPSAYSRAAASGMWQFIAETGQRYGLEIDQAVDERNDPVRATDAALDYLQELHGRFGSWYLAAAAYNTGENRVGRIMRETFGRERAAGEADYYAIWDRLPAETRDYVPLMIAAGRIGKEPERYGFGHVGRGAPLSFAEITVPPATPLDVIARAAGISLDELRFLNPHFRINRTPDDRDYPVRLPSASLGTFASAWARFSPPAWETVVE